MVIKVFILHFNIPSFNNLFFHQSNFVLFFNGYKFNPSSKRWSFSFRFWYFPSRDTTCTIIILQIEVIRWWNSTLAFWKMILALALLPACILLSSTQAPSLKNVFCSKFSIAQSCSGHLSACLFSKTI